MMSSAGGRNNRRAVIPFCLVTLLFGPTAWLGFRDEVMGGSLLAMRSLTARLVTGVLNGLGLDATLAGSAVLHTSGFGMEISRGCTGFVGAALLTVALATYPADRRARLMGLAVCPAAFLVVNLARLVTLFYVGVHQPGVFHVAHAIVGEVVMVAAVVSLWIGWKHWAEEPRPISSAQEHSAFRMYHSRASVASVPASMRARRPNSPSRR